MMSAIIPQSVKDMQSMMSAAIIPQSVKDVQSMMSAIIPQSVKDMQSMMSAAIIPQSVKDVVISPQSGFGRNSLKSQTLSHEVPIDPYKKPAQSPTAQPLWGKVENRVIEMVHNFWSKSFYEKMKEIFFWDKLWECAQALGKLVREIVEWFFHLWIFFIWIFYIN